MLPSSASPLEVAWATVAVLGAGVATALLAHIWLSYRAVAAWFGTGRIVRWGPRHKFVLGFLVGDGLLLLVWCGFVALGVNALLNPPPAGLDRVAASERGGWILVGLESVLFLFQAVLLWAWVAVGHPTLKPGNREPVTLPELFLQATGVGRDLGHLIKNRVAPAVGLIDVTLETAVLTPTQRADLIEARDGLMALASESDVLHQQIKRMEPKP